MNDTSRPTAPDHVTLDAISEEEHAFDDDSDDGIDYDEIEATTEPDWEAGHSFCCM